MVRQLRRPPRRRHQMHRCNCCGRLRSATRAVRIDGRYWDPAFYPAYYCKGSCEIEILRSR